MLVMLTSGNVIVLSLQIITGYTDAEGTKNEENVTVAYQSYYKRRAELFTKQNQLAKRGAASMVLLVITAAQG